MKTLVTGGAGFIGSTLVDRLLREGHDVVVLDDLSTGQISNLDDANELGGGRLVFVEHDIQAPNTEAVIRSHSPEMIFHLAAQINVRNSAEDPVNDASINLLGTVRVLEGARHGARKVVFASSSAIYGELETGDIPVAETHAMAPVSPYGVTKRAALDYLGAYWAMYKLDFTALAFANVFGPRQNSKSEAGVISIFAEKMIKGQPCTIFGDGSQTRDYVYVDDVVGALVAAVGKGSGQVLNIGTGLETSVLEIHELVANAAGVDTPPEFGPAQPGDPQRVALDPRRAAEVLGWQAGTAIQPGIARVVEWSRQVYA